MRLSMDFGFYLEVLPRSYSEGALRVPNILAIACRCCLEMPSRSVGLRVLGHCIRGDSDSPPYLGTF